MLFHSFIAYKVYHNKKDKYWNFEKRQWSDKYHDVDNLTKDLNLARFSCVNNCRIIKTRVQIEVGNTRTFKTVIELGGVK